MADAYGTGSREPESVMANAEVQKHREALIKTFDVFNKKEGIRTSMESAKKRVSDLVPALHKVARKIAEERRETPVEQIDRFASFAGNTGYSAPRGGSSASGLVIDITPGNPDSGPGGYINPEKGRGRF
jgi:hypothetical protein